MFFGYESRPSIEIDESKVKRTNFSCCTRGKKFRGQVPFKVDGDTVWKYVYWDGEPDDGMIITKCTYTTAQHTFCWFEE
jgi:hypothetical protein